MDQRKDVILHSKSWERKNGSYTGLGTGKGSGVWEPLGAGRTKSLGRGHGFQEG